MSDMKRKLIHHRLSKEIKDMYNKYPSAVLTEVFETFPTFNVLQYDVGQMIDADRDPSAILNHIDVYKLELFDAVMDLARKASVLETQS